MADELTPDICIIGGGPGGIAAAAAAASAGARAVLIERASLGGNNLTSGSVPSKALIASASVYAALRAGPGFGVTGAPLQVDVGRIREHMAAAAEAIARNVARERLAALGITVIAGAARFANPDLVAVDTTAIRARHVIIAAGSVPAMPDIPGLDAAEPMTFTNVFDLTRRPTHLVILGGGPYALELAQAYTRLGMDATIVSETPVLPDADPELAAIVIDRLRAEGVGIRAGAKVTEVARRRSGVRLTITDPAAGDITVDASHILAASGRTPDVEGLGLAAAGIAWTPAGITVDRNLRTTNPRVHAIGDAIAGAPLVERARAEGAAVVRTMLRRVPVADITAHVPAVAFTDPGLASVGLGEAEACVLHRDIRVLRFPFAESDRAHIEHDASGMVKAITTANGRRILGAGVVAKNAGELIAPWALAVANRLGVEAMEAFVPPYPTLSDIDRRLTARADGGLASLGIASGIGSLTEEWLRRIIDRIRKLG